MILLFFFLYYIKKENIYLVIYEYIYCSYNIIKNRYLICFDIYLNTNLNTSLLFY